MADTSYVIVFDPLDMNFEPLRITKFLRSDGEISHWWNHLVNCYIVTTHLSSADLTRRLRKHAADVSFLVTKADLTESEGLLPERSWEWIREREHEAAARTRVPG